MSFLGCLSRWVLHELRHKVTCLSKRGKTKTGISCFDDFTLDEA